MLVDGSHRYVRRSQLGLEFMWMIRLTEEQAKLALLDLPDELGAAAVGLKP